MGTRIRRMQGAMVLLVALTCVSAQAEHRKRADITDRNGVALATSVRSASIYANPTRIHDPRASAATLARLIPGADEASLTTKLVSGSFAWIARHVDENVAQSVARRSLQGIVVTHEWVRRYPRGSLTSHVVGFTDGDACKGLAGVEGAYDEVLNQGHPVTLSIDTRLQAVVRDELINALHTYHAKGAAGLVLDAQTFETLAFVSLPDYDANDRRSIEPNGYTNKLTSRVYEMGGVFEIFSTALALDAHQVTPSTLINVNQPLQVGTTLLRDDEPVTHPITVAESFARSSVIGAARLAQTLTPSEQQALMQKLGLLSPMRVELIETVGTPLFHASRWDEQTRTTMGYGYGIAVTPLQAATVATAVMNHGRLLAPTIIKRKQDAKSAARQVISADTSSQMRSLMRQVVTNGTGTSAEVAGLQVGGKTGTSFKMTGGSYDKQRRIAWFIAGFPMNDAPRYTLLVMLDEPQATAASQGKATAQWNAVPVAGRILARMASLVSIAPDTQRIALR